ncbi:NAD(P)H-quinone oxidoreductase [Aureimonas frigidaquae]|uniref:Quinone oxidoreductase n=1 Tax=Aureimonas frigidaquae TaxID=424757 RepID=A0A0P0Z0M8_9HYPH|nr:NAD(P)H-quinone oxidoreductase [Aureimonas frigidaquae]BAT27453.1 quinone oxidoreductase [Aureimonas frigidaquae]
MKAVIARAPGGPEALTVVERPVPVPGPGDVLIRVAAAGVNRPDLMQRSGALPAPAGAGDVLGLEVSGTIVATGEGVDPALQGQAVMALLKAGGYAEHALAKASHCLPVPDGLTPAEAAVLPEGLFTIWHNLFDRGALKRGETVLIEGGASGIGTLALQLAQARGARVIVTAGGAAKCAHLSTIGATAIDYRSDDLVDTVLRLTDGRGVDVVLDILGGEAVNRHLACMAPGGRHIGLSFMTGMIAPVDLGLLMRKGLWLSSSTLRPKSDAEKDAIAGEVREHLLPLIGPGKVRPVLSRSFPLVEAAAAHALLEAGDNVGKIVLLPQDAAHESGASPLVP